MGESVRFVQDGHDVLCVDNFYTGSKRNVAHLLDHPRFELVRHDVTYWQGRGNTLDVRAHLGRVTSVTRDGLAKVVESPSLGTWLIGRSRADDDVLVVPASVDTDALWATYAARRWPTAPDSTQVYPFQSLDEAREITRRHVRSERVS